jgi:hypothetical protein
MKVRLNASMLELLGGDPEFLEPSSIPMPSALVSIASGGFEERDGCLVLRSVPVVAATLRFLEKRDDKTGTEAALSDINIERFLAKSIDRSELSRLGLDFGFFLGKELMRSGFAGPFRVIVSTQPADLSQSIDDTCTVRFHRLRAGEDWLNNDLESYKSEAIAVLDF